VSTSFWNLYPSHTNSCRPIFQTGKAGMMHFADFWNIIAKHVDVIQEDIDYLEEHHLVLASGRTIEADIILCGTGYQDRFPFFSDSDTVELGLPHRISLESPEETAEWKRLEKEAEQKFFKAYPILKTMAREPEHFGDVDKSISPYRLYRGCGPLNGDPSISFTGFCLNTNMFESGEVSALWCIAYLDGNIKAPSHEERRKEIAFVTAYMRNRVATFGRLGNYYIFDKFAYYDKLLVKDLGLTSWIPKGSWWTFWMTPTYPEAFKGVKDEYLEKYRKTVDLES
jgi:hypothetical protein